MNFQKNKTIIYALASIFLWSTVATAFKFALKEMTWINLLHWSSFISFIVFFLNKLIFERSYHINYHLTFSLINLRYLLNPLIYYCLLFSSYSLIPAQEALIVNYSWGIMLVLLSIIILKVNLRVVDISLVFISFFGLIIIVSKGSFQVLNNLNFGILFAFLSSIVWALYWLLSKKLSKNVTSQYNELLVSSLLCFVLISIYKFLNNLVFFDGFDSISKVISVTYIGLFEMGITFIFWNKALKSTDNPTLIGNLVYISPVLSLVFISIFLNEQILSSTIFGFLLILFSNIILQIKNKNRI